MKNVLALISGLVFGFGLILSGMANPAKVIGFLDIAKLNERVLMAANVVTVNDLDDVFEADRYSRHLALDMISSGNFS